MNFPCDICDALGHRYEFSGTCGGKVGLALCDEHAKATWNLPLYDTENEYLDALREQDKRKCRAGVDAA